MKPTLVVNGVLCLVLISTAESSEPNSVTFASSIAPIVHRKCTICHRPGQPGPFNLISFDDVRDRAMTIQAVVDAGYMPPWKPVNENVHFANDRRLSTLEKNLLNEWILAGTPAGDLTKVSTPEFASEWSLGEPDVVLTMTEKYEVRASGPDDYRSFVLPAAFPEDRWVKAIEVRPTAKGALHHALFFVDTTGEARKRDGEDGKPGLKGMSFLRRTGDRSSASGIRSLGGYVPGAMPNKLPGDLALLLPKGGDIVMQTHFHPTGRKEYEQAQVALYFAEKRPSRSLIPIQLPPLFGRLSNLDVPAGKSDFEISQSVRLPVDVEAIGVSGHAHYICREMEMTATRPDGQTMDLLRIDDWDLDWQDQYQFSAPVQLPAGTVIKARISYDNSEDNPENPHSPPRRIKWGRQSTDEMGSVTLQVVAARRSDEAQLKRINRTVIADAMATQSAGLANSSAGFLKNAGSRLRQRIGNGQLIEALDRNSDGKLQKNEVPEQARDRVFGFADRNRDGVLDKSEIETIKKLLERMKR